MKASLSGRLLGAAALAAAFAVPAQAASAASAAPSCTEPAVSQPFLPLGDSNWYTIAPGTAPDNFAATGWTLNGGAKIVSTRLMDGTTGYVLDLPAGSSATSPQMCVDSSYPTARMITRTLGHAPDNSTKFIVSPAGSTSLSGGMPVLGIPGWKLSPPDNVAGAGAAAEEAQVTFVAGARAADLQVYNLYIDPRMRW